MIRISVGVFKGCHITMYSAMSLIVQCMWFCVAKLLVLILVDALWFLK